METKNVIEKEKAKSLKVSLFRTLLCSFFAICANHLFHSNLNYSMLS